MNHKYLLLTSLLCSSAAGYAQSSLAVGSNGMYIESGATVSVAGSVFQNNGAVTGGGTLLLNGALPQVIQGNGTVTNLELNNPFGAFISAGSHTLRITDTYTPTAGTLNTSGNLVLGSDASGTARVAPGTGAYISGDVTVERYITTQRRGWRLLATPLVGNTNAPTIFNTWQEGGLFPSGYGTLVTQPNAGAGYDAVSNGTSLQYWNGTALVTPANTNATKVTDNGSAYFLFVRGDRSVPIGVTAPYAPTTLRMKGDIHTDNVANVGVIGADFSLIPNPYPSPVDFEAIRPAANNVNSFYVWDPSIGGGNIGAYRTVEYLAPGMYEETPAGASSANSNNSARYIQSGQAFFIPGSAQGGPASAITFTESMKAASIPIGINAFKTTGGTAESIIINLTKLAAGGTMLADGLRIKFDASYSDSVASGEDIRKRSNMNENFSVLNDTVLLAVEKRMPVTATDTIQLHLTNASGNYEFELMSDNLSSALAVYLIDDYMASVTPMNAMASTIYPFMVTSVAGSNNPNRFRLAVVNGSPLQVAGITLAGTSAGKTAHLNWIAKNEDGVAHYEVEKSANGTSFTKIHTVKAKANNKVDVTYEWPDEEMYAGSNYYRIASIAVNGDKLYSNTLRLQYTSGETPAVVIFPNPIRHDGMNVQFTNLSGGAYEVRLYSISGALVSKTVLSHSGGNAVHTISFGKELASGTYHVSVVNTATGTAYQQQVQVQ